MWMSDANAAVREMSGEVELDVSNRMECDGIRCAPLRRSMHPDDESSIDRGMDSRVEWIGCSAVDGG